jgi:hypothetical protein
MNWIIAKMKWILLVSGLLTCTMIYAVIAPQAALLSTFGESLEGPLMEIIVRNWGALITLMGVLLLYGAFNPPSRRLIVTVAGLSKLLFIALVLTYGRHYLGHQVGLAIAIDAVAVLLFSGYLIGVGRSPTAV